MICHIDVKTCYKFRPSLLRKSEKQIEEEMSL
jgi:hypothetical protein